MEVEAALKTEQMRLEMEEKLKAIEE